jgi:hypothetical protein
MRFLPRVCPSAPPECDEIRGKTPNGRLSVCYCKAWSANGANSRSDDRSRSTSTQRGLGGIVSLGGTAAPQTGQRTVR